MVPEGTTIFVVRGMSLKSEFRIGIAMKPMAFGQDCKALRARDGIDGRFLAYAIKAQTARILDLVDEAGHGTGRLNTDQMKELMIGVPTPDEQREIVAVLSALDDKIEANRRLVKSADALIATELAAALADNWPRESVSSLARFVNGGAFTKGASGTGRMVLRIAELNSGPGGSTVYSDRDDVPEDKLARPGDILMSWSGSLGVYRWIRDEAIINQHIFKVITCGKPPWLIYAKLMETMPEFRRIAADKATTMGHIKRHHLDDTLVKVPPQVGIDDLDLYLGPTWERIVAAEVESLTIAALRDALLPELLTGRLRVEEAERLAEAAT